MSRKERRAESRRDATADALALAAAGDAPEYVTGAGAFVRARDVGLGKPGWAWQPVTSTPPTYVGKRRETVRALIRACRQADLPSFSKEDRRERRRRTLSAVSTAANACIMAVTSLAPGFVAKLPDVVQQAIPHVEDGLSMLGDGRVDIDEIAGLASKHIPAATLDGIGSALDGLDWDPDDDGAPGSPVQKLGQAQELAQLLLTARRNTQAARLKEPDVLAGKLAQAGAPRALVSFLTQPTLPPGLIAGLQGLAGQGGGGLNLGGLAQAGAAALGGAVSKGGGNR